jgi:hypothetical protein
MESRHLIGIDAIGAGDFDELSADFLGRYYATAT